MWHSTSDVGVAVVATSKRHAAVVAIPACRQKSQISPVNVPLTSVRNLLITGMVDVLYQQLDSAQSLDAAQSFGSKNYEQIKSLTTKDDIK